MEIEKSNREMLKLITEYKDGLEDEKFHELYRHAYSLNFMAKCGYNFKVMRDGSVRYLGDSYNRSFYIETFKLNFNRTVEQNLTIIENTLYLQKLTLEQFSDFSANIEFFEENVFFGNTDFEIKVSKNKPIVYLCQFLCGMPQDSSECDKLFENDKTAFSGQVGNIKINRFLSGHLHFGGLTDSQSARLNDMLNTYKRLKLYWR